jgi:hypothetical protein
MAEKTLSDAEIAEYLSKQPKEKQKELLKKANALRGRETSADKTIPGSLDLLKKFASIKKGDKVSFKSTRGGSGNGAFISVDVTFSVKVGDKVKKISLASIK